MKKTLKHITLSTANSSTFNYHKMDIRIEEEIPSADYEKIIKKDVDRISSYLNEFMLQHNINIKDIDSLFLTGGTSMVASIQQLFKTKFPHLTLNSGDNFKSVAKGLAYSGYLFEEKK